MLLYLHILCSLSFDISNKKLEFHSIKIKGTMGAWCYFRLRKFLINKGAV